MISVVIPTCRRPDLLARCLDQLAPGVQTLSPEQYEVLVTDDGEPSVEQLITDKYPWATWNAGPRRGPAANRNTGAQQARGEWVAFTDDDCIPDAGWLAAFLSAVHPGCDVYEGKTICKAGIRSPLDHAPGNETGGYLWSCNMMVSRDRFKDMGGFDENFPYPCMEDVDFRERLRDAGGQFNFVPEAVVDHPPRRLAGGWRRARMHESWVYHWYKSGRTGYATPRLLKDVLHGGLNHIRFQSFSVDSVRAAGSLAIEVGGVLVQALCWERKYRSRLRLIK